MTKLQNVGLLILRIGIGLAFIIHGWPKITGGPEVWTKLGAAMGMLGISFIPVFWGFLAACSEFIGAILLLTGLFTRVAAFFMLCVMLVACNMHIH
ncbi:MAG: DoxX family protein [Chlamydiota bacterium]|nr:DoxX family protein [Chlamydiota bacterium]